jgi:ring-1,2-phenylacetyl-CoA epoxidase subunit PaaD
MAAATEELLAERERRVWALLEGVPDPEIPALSIVDLGIVRHVHHGSGRAVHVGITPTYLGCPATEVIRGEGAQGTRSAGGFHDAPRSRRCTPPWSSAWLTSAGRQKLQAFGIAPPQAELARPRHLWQAPAVTCPRCASPGAQRVSEFGSTPCKAHYRCRACGEPFDYFKCI